MVKVGKFHYNTERMLYNCTVFVSLQKTTIEHVQDAFATLGLETLVCTVPTPLCKHHYHMVYNTIHPTQYHCVTCGLSLKHSKPKPCPDPEKIEDYLKEKVGFQGSIGVSDSVCNSCYRSHLFIMKQTKTVSTDRDLQELIGTINQKIPSHVQSIGDLIEVTTHRVVAAVGRELLNGNPLLLPDVHDWFHSLADELSHHLKEDVDTSKLVTSSNILSNLIAILQHHIAYTCKTKKYGTLLYRPDTDLTEALAHALWKLRQHSKDKLTPVEDINSVQEPNSESQENTKVLNELNSLACSHINTFLKNNKKDEFELLDLNIDEEIKKIDPRLWEAVCILTRSMSQKRAPSKASEVHLHTKKIRRFFIFCTMMYTINGDFTIPLHTLITDIVEGQGGSALLKQVLNQLGACSSADTLNRYIQEKRTNNTHTMNQCLNTESFIVISADNIDFVHPYARVCKGKKSSSSWHGTSIQAVQPLPSISEVVSNVSADLEPQHGASKRNREVMDSPCSLLPAPKRRIKPRTGTELSTTENVQNSELYQQQPHPNLSVPHKACAHKISDFLLNQHEELTLSELKEELTTYMVQKVAVATKDPDKAFLNLQDYFSCTRASHTEQSKVYYLNIMDAKSDNKDTLMSMLYDLHQEFIQQQKGKYLLVEGDAKVYELLQALKFEYGEDLQWVVPFPGDWHTLMNYQSALMKPYFDAGLKSLAEVCGYSVAAIQHCSQFKRTHNFITEAWEAIYRIMLMKFIQSGDATTSSNVLDDVLNFLEIAKGATRSELRSNFNIALRNILQCTPKFTQEFDSFIKKMSKLDETWKFWAQFIFVDAMAYIGLFLAIRTGNWHLRTASAKQMAPLFTAFDHPTYQKLISNHIADLLDLPDSIMLMLTQGAFVVNISGREGHSVAIDEAHEMLINRQCKDAVVKPSEDYMNRVANYITYRTKSLEAFREQLFPSSLRKPPNNSSMYSSSHLDIKFETNVLSQMNALSKAAFFDLPKSNRGLINFFNDIKASGDNHYDLTNFRKIGEDEYKLRISYFILKQPSVKAPNRKKALQTFSVKKSKSKKVSQLERDKKLLVSAMKKKIQYAQRIGKPVEKPDEQLLEYPLSISDNEGNPLKGQKSNFTKTLMARYNGLISPHIITPHLPPGWTPQCSLIEGMFIINTLPLPNHSTLGDYGTFLLNRFVISQFKRGSIEVHVIFDTPGRLQNTPKYFEQKRRDIKATIPANHTCDKLTNNTILLRKKWRENFLNCRKCKRNLVIFLGNHFLKHASTYLSRNQTLYVAGAFEGEIADTAWFVTSENDPQPDPLFRSNAEETDTRLWLHVKKTRHERILVLSPDTDVYMIGIALQSVHKIVVLQINKYSARELRYLNLSGLKTALQNDPALGSLSCQDLPQILQAIYVCTGCDYVSFFSGIGKATFMKYFVQYTPFISGGSNPGHGSLANVNLHSNWKVGLLAFLRLVGTIYFKKHSSGFDTQSPEVHFKRFFSPSTTIEDQHYQWLNNIRETIWYRTKFDNEMVASNEALVLHWRRSCWIIHMWSQADRNDMTLEPITQHGWSMKDGLLRIEWDTEENIRAIRERVYVLTRGCKCLSGCCTNHCSCKKKNKKCSVGCECQHCTNIATSTVTAISTVVIADTTPADPVPIDHDDTEYIMNVVFGKGQFDETEQEESEEERSENEADSDNEGIGSDSEVSDNEGSDSETEQFYFCEDMQSI